MLTSESFPFCTILFRGQHDSTNFHDFFNQPAGYSYLFSNIGITAPHNPDASKAGSLRTSGLNRPIIERQRESRGDIHIPPPGMVRNLNFGSHFVQTLDQPIHGPLYFFAPDIELTDHVQEIVGYTPIFSRAWLQLLTLLF
jgi:hypothetical protein